MKKLLPLRSVIPVLVIAVFYSLAFAFVGTVGGYDDAAHISEGSVVISNDYHAEKVKLNTPVLATTAPEQEYAQYVVMTWNKAVADDNFLVSLATTTTTTTPQIAQTTPDVSESTDVTDITTTTTSTTTTTEATSMTTSIVATQGAPEITTIATTTTTPAQTSAADTTSNPDAQSSDSAASGGSVSVEDTTTANLANTTFTFKTYGYGHGCGLSQNGANYFALYGGYDYTQILAHFYPGATLANTGITGSETISVNGVSGTVIDIISMVCNQEVGPSFHEEAIKAQAVAAYTFVMYNGGSASGLGMRANPPEKIVNCVTEVLGQALFYNGNYILSQFYASSGGASASCKDIFTADLPYLRSVECPYDEIYDPHYGTEKSFTAEYVKAELESRLGITLSDNIENWIVFTEGDGGYIASVCVDGQVTVKGQKFRSYFGLKSANMDVFVNIAQ